MGTTYRGSDCCLVSLTSKRTLILGNVRTVKQTLLIGAKMPRKPLIEIDEITLINSIKICSGRFQEADVNLYSIVCDEIFFMPAFFEYYRGLGVQQFILLDDGSTDGTVEFLRSQPDCVLLASNLTYGQDIVLKKVGGKCVSGRAGIFLKRAIPEKFLMNKYVLYVDADEFLILPDEFEEMLSLFDDMSKRKLPCVAASVVDFYPANVSDLDRRDLPVTFADLLAGSPYYDAEPLLNMKPGAQPTLAGTSFSARLFREYGIKETPFSFLPEWVIKALPFPVPGAVWRKTPIIRWSKDVWMNGSHRANVPPPADRFLALAHFKFTSDLPRRVEAAMQRQAHSKKSQKYFHYSKLLKKMQSSGGIFIGPTSCTFEGPANLTKAGLMRWPA
jgi:glycosyltransferase involved in cell wall biosynthesis